MAEAPKKLEVSEADKPFILSLIFVIGFFVLLLFGAVGALLGNTNVTGYITSALTGVSGIVGTVVGFYFKTKSS